ncbi:MAG: hypothetical protein E7586_03985 [Ruminococcaceae bacterium]|nr:hypothetical protein [Oscillospiraceae bacterium]
MAGKLIVSLDFELLWGVLDSDSHDEYQPNVLGGRKAIPQLLELFKKYDIHATWATVGFMFAENSAEAKKYFPEENRLPTYDNKKLSPYNAFGEKAGSDDEADCYYAPEIIKLISETNGQEIGTHTFSHFYCREEGQTAEQFEADMRSAIEIAKAKGYDIKSVILPRNQTTDESTAVLSKLGFTAYRDEENDWIHEKVKLRPLMRVLRLMDVYLPLTGNGGYNPEKQNGIVNLVGSRMYKPYFKPLFFLEKLKIHRIKRQMYHAAKNGLTFHLWWHPHNIGVKTDFHFQQLEEIFGYYTQLKEKFGMCSLNMQEAADSRKETD